MTKKQANDNLKRFLADRGWPETVADALSPLLAEEAPQPYVHLYLKHPGRHLPFDEDEYEGMLIAYGLLCIGSCPNGDFVAIDCEREIGSIVYISHEEFNYDRVKKQDMDEISARVAPSMEDYLTGLNEEDERMPLDFYETEKAKSRL